MQYMLMIISQASWSMPEEQRDALLGEYDEFLQTIVRSGHFRSTARLHPSSTATTLRMQNGKPILTDGPFAETKEQFGGFIIVECNDLDEAIGIAKRVPSLRFGDPIEVRPVAPFPAQ